VDVSSLAQLAGIIAVVIALPGAFVAIRGWRLRSRHWLYIPAPNVLTQDPGSPDFWVFPPMEMGDGTYAIVIAGALINAGPSDAFSIRVHAEPEFSYEEGVEPLKAAIDIAAQHPRIDRERREVAHSFLEAYKTRKTFFPVLPVGERARFIVVAKFDAADPYLRSVLKRNDGEKVAAGTTMSCYWEHEGKQAHRVHAASRTILGRKLNFGPNDLCSPFERDRDLRRWRAAAGEPRPDA
jgi:hypothetical protein